jgi:hypothetical protein
MVLSSFDGFLSRLLDLGNIGIHDFDFHGPAPEPLTSEVLRVDVDSPVPALHYSGDELVGMQRVINARQDLFDRPKVAA